MPRGAWVLVYAAVVGLVVLGLGIMSLILIIGNARDSENLDALSASQSQGVQASVHAAQFKAFQQGLGLLQLTHDLRGLSNNTKFMLEANQANGTEFATFAVRVQNAYLMNFDTWMASALATYAIDGRANYSTRSLSPVQTGTLAYGIQQRYATIRKFICNFDPTCTVHANPQLSVAYGGGGGAANVPLLGSLELFSVPPFGDSCPTGSTTCTMTSNT